MRPQPSHRSSAPPPSPRENSRPAPEASGPAPPPPTPESSEERATTFSGPVLVAVRERKAGGACCSTVVEAWRESSSGVNTASATKGWIRGHKEDEQKTAQGQQGTKEGGCRNNKRLLKSCYTIWLPTARLPLKLSKLPSVVSQLNNNISFVLSIYSFFAVDLGFRYSWASPRLLYRPRKKTNT